MMVNHIFIILCTAVLLQIHVSLGLLFPGEDILQKAHQPQIELQQFKNLYNSLSEMLNRKNWMELLTNPKAMVRPSKECTESFGRFFGHMPGRPIDIAYLIDSFAKPEPGILEGNTRWLGNWDECSALNNTRYITLSATIQAGLALSFDICLPVECENRTNIIGLLDDLLVGELINTSLISTYPHLPHELTPGRIATILLLSVFVILILISTCADMIERAISTVMRIFSNDIQDRIVSDIPNYDYADGHITKRKTLVNEPGNDFTGNNSVPDEYSKLLVSETYAIVGRKRVTNIFRKIYEPFSLYTNIQKVFDTHQPPGAIRCLNGIRAISMFWVILGHIYLISLSALTNMQFMYTDVATRFSFQPVLNGYFSVDSFFLLSGFLVMYLSLRELGRTKKRARNYALFLVKFYIHRILRITPTFLVVLLFYWQLSPLMSDGPLWRPGTDAVTDVCDNFGWLYPILYVNNFYPPFTDIGCMSWTWYLANDMQFFIFSPLFIFPAFFLPFQFALIPLAIAIVIFLIPSFIIAWAYSLHSNFYFPINHLTDGLLPIALNMTRGDLINDYYIKPYCRINPYLIGLALGYIIWKVGQWRLEGAHRRMLDIGFMIINIFMWPISFAICFGLVYGMYGSFHGHLMTEFENILYIGTSRTLWGLGLAMFVFICYSGMGGPVDSFLSWGVFVPLSRLTFTAYLIHPVVVTMFLSSLRDTISYYDITHSFLIVGLIAMSYAVAAVIAVCIEFPLSNVEDLILRRKKKENKRK